MSNIKLVVYLPWLKATTHLQKKALRQLQCLSQSGPTSIPYLTAHHAPKTHRTTLSMTQTFILLCLCTCWSLAFAENTSPLSSPLSTPAPFVIFIQVKHPLQSLLPNLQTGTSPSLWAPIMFIWNTGFPRPWQPGDTIEEYGSSEWESPLLSP